MGGEVSSNRVGFMNGRQSIDTEDNGFNQIITIGTPKLAESQEVDENGQYIMNTNSVRGFVNDGKLNKHIRLDTLDTHNSQTYTGISDIIMNQNLQNMKRNAILTYLMFKKDSTESARLKAYGMNKWKNFMRELEMWVVKGEFKRLVGEIENLKF